MVSEQASLPVRCGLGTNQAEAGGLVTVRLNTYYNERDPEAI